MTTSPEAFPQPVESTVRLGEPYFFGPETPLQPFIQHRIRDGVTIEDEVILTIFDVTPELATTEGPDFEITGVSGQGELHVIDLTTEHYTVTFLEPGVQARIKPHQVFWYKNLADTTSDDPARITPFRVYDHCPGFTPSRELERDTVEYADAVKHLVAGGLRRTLTLDFRRPMPIPKHYVYL